MMSQASSWLPEQTVHCLQTVSSLLSVVIAQHLQAQLCVQALTMIHSIHDLIMGNTFCPHLAVADVTSLSVTPTDHTTA